ncbi:MAG: HipA domain-containing protein [Bacillota bacterium]|nr:HipA domain-containing protein [Bacillota bacterium]
MEYSIFPRNNKIYSGAEKKIGIVINDEDFIIKFRKKTRFGIRNNHISEYLGCRIIESLNISVQKVYLGTYEGEEIVAIKDFVKKDQQFVAFNDIGESSIEEDRDRFTYSYYDITQILYLNNKLENPDETVHQFWNMYIIDALLGNFDRHGGNWGFIKRNNVYSLAPIFDNGSCLFPNLTDEREIKNVIKDQNETLKRVYDFPTSQILLYGKKNSYYEIISSLAYAECNNAVKRIYSLYNYDSIVEIIDDTIFISDLQKEFYKHIILQRFNLIIKEPFERLMQNEKTHC